MSGFDMSAWLKSATGTTSTTEPAAAAPVTSTVPQRQPLALGLQSTAADALAAAVAAGSHVASKQLQALGTAIAPYQEVLEVGSKHDNQSALVVSKIAVVKSEYSRRFTQCIAVDSTYICYGLKAGQIRVLNRHTGGRTLCKDHSVALADMQFFRHEHEHILLASADVSGAVHVRKLLEDDNDDVIKEELLVQHVLPLAEATTRKLAWHPNFDFVLAVAATDRVCFINVPPTPEVASAPEFAAPVMSDGPVTNGTITCLAFSPKADMLAVSDTKGYVYVWGLSPEALDPGRIEPLPAEPDIKFQAYEAPNFCSMLEFMLLPAASTDGTQPSDDGDVGKGTGGGASGPVCLVTGDSTNRILKLWSVDIESKPVCSHSLELVAAAGATRAAPGAAAGQPPAPTAFFNHLVLQSLYGLVVLADELRNTVHILHMRSLPDPDTGAPGFVFDHACEFTIAMPILSLSVIPETFVDEVTNADAFHLYTVQSEAIQQYTLVAAQCFPLDDKQQQHPQQPHAGGVAHGLDAGAQGVAATLADLAAAAAAAHAAAAQQQPLPEPPAATTALAAKDIDDTGAVAEAAAASSAAKHELLDSSSAVPHPPPLPAGSAAEAVESEVEPTVAELEAEAAAPPPPPRLLTPSQLLHSSSSPGTTPAATSAAHTPSSPPAPPPAAAALAALVPHVVGAAAAGGPGGHNDEDSAVSVHGSSATPSILTPSTSELALAEAITGGEADDTTAPPSQPASMPGDVQAHALEEEEEEQAKNEPEPAAPATDTAAVVAAAVAVANCSISQRSPDEQAAATAVPLTAASPEADLAQAASGGGAVPAPPPPPSDMLVRRVSQSRSSSMSSALPPVPSPTSSGSALLPLSDLTGVAAVTAAAAATATGTAMAANNGGAVGAAAKGVAAPAATGDAGVLAAVTGMVAQLEAKHQQLLQQVLAGQREVVKSLKGEISRTAKAAESAARAAEAAAKAADTAAKQRSADDRAAVQKVVKEAVAQLSRDLTNKLNDFIKTTTTAVAAAVGAAVKAALAESLPQALASGAGAAALERAVSSAVRSQLPRAVSDGLAATFTAQVVPPLERGTQAMFTQVEAALQAGIQQHLTPLSAMQQQVRDAAQQLQAAAATLRTSTSTAANATTAPTGRTLQAPPPPPHAATALTSSITSTAAMPQASGAATGSTLAPQGPANGTNAGKPRPAAPDVSIATAGVSIASTISAAPSQAPQQAAPRAQQAAAAKPPKAAAAAAASPAGVPAPPPPTADTPTPTPAAPKGSVMSISTAVSVAPRSDIASTADSSATTSEPVPAAIQALLAAGQYNDAFIKALETGPVELVIAVCRQAPQDLLSRRRNETCCLTQPCLLSLLCYLSSDLATTDTTDKLKWIEAIAPWVDPTDEIIAKHVRGVLENTRTQVMALSRSQPARQQQVKSCVFALNSVLLA